VNLTSLFCGIEKLEPIIANLFEHSVSSDIGPLTDHLLFLFFTY